MRPIVRLGDVSRSGSLDPAQVPGDKEVVLMRRLIIALVVIAVAVAGAYSFSLLRGGDDDVVSPQLVASLEDVFSVIPAASGDSDLEQMRSLLGPPDAFTLMLEPQEGGEQVRREEWYYYDLLSVFEFADGKLVANLPLEKTQSLLIVPLQYDPADFQLGTTWQEVARKLSNPGELQSYELEEEFDLAVTYYVGAQLLLAFDDEGLLFYVETLPLEAEAIE